MTTWYSLASLSEIERLEEAWSDAPTEMPEICNMILDTARDQVMSYAGWVPVLGVLPVTLELPEASASVRVTTTPNFETQIFPVAGGVTGTVTLTRSGDLVLATFDLTWAIQEKTDLPAHVGTPSYGFDASGWGAAIPAAFALPAGVTVESAPEGLPRLYLYTVEDSQDWTIHPPYDVFHPSPSPYQVSIAWAADPLVGDVEMVPSNLAYAQLQQAKNLWNAGRAQQGGEIGGDTYSFIPRPLDKTIQQIIRPRRGVPNVF